MFGQEQLKTVKMEIIALSQRTVKEIGGLNKLSKSNVGLMCRYFLQTLVSGNSTVELDPSLDEPLCALSTLFLESAKIQATAQQLNALLKEHGVNADLSATLAEVYNQHRDTMIRHMQLTGISSPAIVDIDWRLDYSVRSRHGGRENKPLFFVSLKVKDRGIVTSLDMLASQAELQDMLGKVRDAVKQVERLLSTNS